MLGPGRVILVVRSVSRGPYYSKAIMSAKLGIQTYLSKARYQGSQILWAKFDLENPKIFAETTLTTLEISPSVLVLDLFISSSPAVHQSSLLLHRPDPLKSVSTLGENSKRGQTILLRFHIPPSQSKLRITI